MTYPLTKALAVGTATYAIFAATKPRHLADALQLSGPAAQATDRLAYTYAVRDLAISSLAFAPGMAPAAGLLRIVGDVGDAAVLGSSAPSESRSKVVGVPLAWGALNTIALLIDSRQKS